LLLTAPLIPLFMILIGDRAEALTRRQWGLLSRMSAHFLDVLQGLPTLKLFGRSRAQIQVISQVGERYRETTLGVLKGAFLSALVLELVATLSTAVVAVEIGLRVLYGRLAFENALFVLLLASSSTFPRLLGSRFHAGMSDRLCPEPLLDFGNACSAENLPPGTSRSAIIPPGEPVSIKFEECELRLPGVHRP
jgi:ATP-binding cassette subfamily C protein CydD